MKVAIVGSGISGLSAASALAKAGHSVTIFEKSGHVGGHARTTVVDGTPVDVGFQLLNRWGTQSAGDCSSIGAHNAFHFLIAPSVIQAAS
jgi:predicted NAD/FAD-binding protein